MQADLVPDSQWCHRPVLPQIWFLPSVSQKGTSRTFPSWASRRWSSSENRLQVLPQKRDGWSSDHPLIFPCVVSVDDLLPNFSSFHDLYDRRTQTVVVRFSPPIWVAYSPVCPIGWWRSWCPVLSLWTTTTSRPPPFELVVCFRLLAVLLLEVQNPPLLAEPVLGVLLDVDSTDLECDAKRCWGLGGATRPPLWMLPENLETSLDHDRSCRYCGAANGDALRWGCSETIFEFWIPNSCETSSTISDQSSKSSLVSVPKFQPVTSVLSVIDNWTRVSPQQLLQGWTPMQDNNTSQL